MDDENKRRNEDSDYEKKNWETIEMKRGTRRPMRIMSKCVDVVEKDRRHEEKGGERLW